MRNFFHNFILKDINIIDVENGNVYNKNVYVSNGLISKITKSLDLSLNYQEINCKNKFLFPGLIDSHCHVSSCFLKDIMTFSNINIINNQIKKNLFNCIKNGITTIRDMSSPLKLINYFKEEIQNKKVIGPRIFFSGPIISIKNGYPNDIPSDLYPFSFYIGKTKSDFVSSISEDEIKNYIWELIENGIDFLNLSYVGKTENNDKLPIFSNETIKLIIDFSKNYNKSVSVNVLFYDDFIKIVNYNIDSLEHIVKDKVIEIDLWEKVKQENIYLVPTLKSNFIEENNIEIAEKYFEKEIINSLKNKNFHNKQNDKYRNIITENIKNAINNDVKIISSSNAGTELNLFGSLLDELLLLNKLGLDNLKTLQSCTINAAKLLKLESYIGSILEGKFADFLILSNNPLEQIENLSSIEYVVKEGAFYNF
ncbi:MAG: amidohydrolase [Candidatus Sericytochromatia bacterium]|nr:MAG: amidohydrolase [Candidatus Sericytochromatia bacterium]